MAQGSLFARILEYRGLVARAQLHEARERQAQLAKSGHQRDLGTVLVAMGALNKKQLDEVVGGRAAKLRCTTCGAVPADQRVAPAGWPACDACNGRIDITQGSSKLEAVKPAGAGEDPLAATLELGLSPSDVATMKGKTPDLVVPVSTKSTPADPPPPPQLVPGLPRPPVPGDELGGCRIERKLGQGGMGAVFLATHLMLDKPVALKILDPRLMNTKEVIGRFQLEARAAAKLDHENIVRVLNVGAENGLYFMTQEFVQGESLMDLLKRKGPLPPRKAAAVIREIARGLAAAHNEGVVHRDIKPGNVMLTPEGKVKVADFGLAKEMHSDAELSHTGQVLGSPHYLSPEQGAGRPVDHRTDLYALGVTYFFLLSGKRPFDGATPIAVIFKHINEAPPKVTKFAPKTPPGHVAIISKCLKKDPDDRYPDAETLIADLDAVIAGRSPKAAEGSGGLSTVRDKPVPKPLSTRYTKEQLESRAEITDQGSPPERPPGAERSKRARDGGRETPPRTGPGVFGKLVRFVAALLLVAGLAAGGFWLWKPADAREYWTLAVTKVNEWTGLETDEDRAKAALSEADAAAATMAPGDAAKAYQSVVDRWPATVAAVQAIQRARELTDEHEWQQADGESHRLTEEGQLQAAMQRLERFVADRPSARQTAQANRRIEGLRAALAADTAGREGKAHAALVPLQDRVKHLKDPLHQKTFPELIRALNDVATRYAGAASAAEAGELAEKLQRTRDGAVATSLKSLRRRVTEELDPATEWAAIEAAGAAWLDRFGDTEAATEVEALLTAAAERREAALNTKGWNDRLAKLQATSDQTPDAWTAILKEAAFLRANATDPDVAAAAAKIEKATLKLREHKAFGAQQNAQNAASNHSDRGELLAALRALQQFDMEAYGATSAGATIRREIARVEQSIDAQLTDPLEWVKGSDAADVKRAREAAAAAPEQYAGSAYAERAAALRDAVVAAADASAAEQLAAGAKFAEAGKLEEALAAYRFVEAAGNEQQQMTAALQGVELRGRNLLAQVRGHLRARSWAAARQGAQRVRQDPTLRAFHPTAQALARHAEALGDGMVYVAGALVPRPGGGKSAVAPFYIDRLEVSAAQYHAFVKADGYRTDAYWPDTLPLESRLKRYRDRTGRTAPRVWRDGAPPEGTADHPVRGVTWYEARAYAAFRKKQLPTEQQWIAAAGWDGAAGVLRTYPWGDTWDAAKAYAGRENLKSPTMPVDSLPAGASPSGCLHMAGNVREWTADPFDRFKNPDGEKLVMGCGAVSLDPADEAKVTARHGKAPHSAGEDVGIRCVRPAPTLEQLGLDAK